MVFAATFGIVAMAALVVGSLLLLANFLVDSGISFTGYMVIMMMAVGLIAATVAQTLVYLAPAQETLSPTVTVEVPNG